MSFTRPGFGAQKSLLLSRSPSLSQSVTHRGTLSIRSAAAEKQSSNVPPLQPSFCARSPPPSPSLPVGFTAHHPDRMCKFNVAGLPASKPGSGKQTLAAYDDEFLQFTYKVSLQTFAGLGAPVWGVFGGATAHQDSG